MRIVTKKKSESWASARSEEPFTWPAMERVYCHNVTYLLPNDAGRKTALARALSSLLDTTGEGLFWITGWGIFPSCENMALFDGYRRSLREERSLNVAPGHMFEGSDLREVECLFDLVLYFFWDASVFDSHFIWLRISHDEVLTINARNREALASWQESLAAFELKELSSST